MEKVMKKWILCLGMIVAACGGGHDHGAHGGGNVASEGRVAPGERMKVVATIGMIADVASRVAGEHADVEALMGPGVDPHLYKAGEGDVRKLSGAHLILYNGLGLEGKMADVLERLARERPVVAVSEQIPEPDLNRPPEFEGQYDPHIWFDVRLWAKTLDVIARAMGEVDPTNAEAYRRNAEALQAELLELDAWVEKEIRSIPEERRVLVTAHDAFGYYGERYGIEVMALQGVSTASEAGLQDVENLARVIVERGIPAIFVESSVPRRSVEAVQAAVRAAGGDVEIGGELFSDAMGEPGTEEGTYVGMVRHNTRTIVEALR